jgi:hypothetical protein
MNDKNLLWASEVIKKKITNQENKLGPKQEDQGGRWTPLFGQPDGWDKL